MSYHLASSGQWDSRGVLPAGPGPHRLGVQGDIGEKLQPLQPNSPSTAVLSSVLIVFYFYFFQMIQHVFSPVVSSNCINQIHVCTVCF